MPLIFCKFTKFNNKTTFAKVNKDIRMRRLNFVDDALIQHNFIKNVNIPCIDIIKKLIGER